MAINARSAAVGGGGLSEGLVKVPCLGFDQRGGAWVGALASVRFGRRGLRADGAGPVVGQKAGRGLLAAIPAAA